MFGSGTADAVIDIKPCKRPVEPKVYQLDVVILLRLDKIWSFSALAVGSVQSYTLYNENGNKRRIFQNFLDAKAGDMIIGYESTPVKQIVAIGRVSAEQDGEKIYFEKIEGLSSPIDFATLKECSELAKMEYFTMQQGSLFRLTKGEYDFIIDMIREENPLTVPDTVEKYDKAAFLDEVYAHTTQVQYDKHTLHSNNLYQIFTYVKNKDSEFGDKPHEVSGMLLYAQTDEAVQPDNTYMMSGNRISVKTLDLNCDFSEIANQLNAIAEGFLTSHKPAGGC